MSAGYFAESLPELETVSEVMREASSASSQANSHSEVNAADRDNNSIHSDQDGQIEVRNSFSLYRFVCSFA